MRLKCLQPHGKPLPLAILLCCLTACSLIPRQAEVTLPIPATYPAVTQQTQIRHDWQSFASDERLQQVLQLALDNNQDFALAALQLARTAAQYRVQSAQKLPSVSVSGQLQRNGDSRVAGVRSEAQLGVSLNLFELDLFGRVASLEENARREYRASEAEWHAARLALLAAVSSHYLVLLADEENRQLQQQSLDSYQQTRQLVSQKLAAGMATRQELQQVEGELQNASAELTRQLRQQRHNRQAMWQLLGIQDWPHALLPADLTLSTNGPELPPLSAGLPGDLVSRRPDIVAAEQRLLAANAGIGAARAAFLPRLTLTGSSGRISDSLSGLFRQPARGWQLLPQLELPVFDGGTRQATLDLARNDHDIATILYRKALRQAFSEVSDALIAEDSWQQQLQAAQARLAAANEAQTLAEQRYRHGSASYLELLETRRSAHRAKLLLLEDKLAAWHNRIALFKALGGGWQTEGYAQGAQS